MVRVRFGALTAHLVSDPALVQQVLQTRARKYGKQTRGNAQLKLFLGQGLLTSEGDFWLRQRRISQPAFHKRRVEALAPTMASIVESFAKNVPVGRPFDMHEAMMTVTREIVARTLLGADLSDEEGELVAAATDFVTAEVNRRLSAPVQLPLEWPTPKNREFRRHRENLDRVCTESSPRDDAPRSRRAVRRRGEDLLTLLLESRDPETGEKMTDEQLRDEVMTIFLAGHETTANAMTWTFALLSRHPSVARRLHEELDAVLGGRVPTQEDVPNLVYTRQILDESMRLYPPAWMTARAAEEDDELGGYFIPKGSLVFLSPWVVHRHPDYFEDPEGFDPERFAPGKKLSHRFAYFPFGGGARLCIGRGFALLEATLVLATLAQRYRFDLVPGQRLEPEPAVTLRPRETMDMVAHPRGWTPSRRRRHACRAKGVGACRRRAVFSRWSPPGTIALWANRTSPPP